MQSLTCLCFVYHCFSRSSWPFFTCFAWAVKAFSLIAHDVVFLSHWGCAINRFVSNCLDFDCYIHNFGRASERSSLRMKRSQRNFTFLFFIALQKQTAIFPCLSKNCWEVYPELLLAIPHGNYCSNTWSYISSQSFTTLCMWWIIMSDCGPQFREHKIGQFAVKFGFRHITASLHHSQYNRRWKKALK